MRRKVKRIEPGPGQESVWDYPRPPRVARSKRRAKVVFNDVVVAESDRALKVCERSGPPTYYIPEADVRTDLLVPSDNASYCEWKGAAAYFDLVVDDRTSRNAAWYYPSPKQSYRVLDRHVAFYAGRVDAAYLDEERVQPQPGHFYGGWITHEIVGPFKGAPGSFGW
jgi:uncharacterized protein (DUF427 family)